MLPTGRWKSCGFAELTPARRTLDAVHTLVVFASGKDQPGIVAAVTGALFECGANLLDCSMTLLSGQFAIVMVVEVPASVRAPEVELLIAGAAQSFDLVVTARQVEEPQTHAESTRYLLSVYGSDKPGIVHSVAKALASDEVNITDVETRLIGTEEEPIYAMLMELALPATINPDVLSDKLSTVATELGVDVTLHESEAEIL